MKNFFFISLAVLSLLIFSCNSGKNWNETKLENTLDGYQEFLSNNSETEHKDSVLLLIREFDWLNAKSTLAVSPLDSFLLKYPENIEYIDSVNFLKEQLAYDSALETNTIIEFRNFIESYPNGRNMYEAKRKIESLRWLEVKALNKKVDYIEFFADFTMKNYIDSIDIKFVLRDFVGYAVSFESVEVDDLNEIYEKITFNFNANRKLTGEYNGGSEGDYNVGWGGEVRGKFDENGINELEIRQMDFSDVSDFEPEPWGEFILIFDEIEMTFSSESKTYKLVEIDRIKK